MRSGFAPQNHGWGSCGIPSTLVQPDRTTSRGQSPRRHRRPTFVKLWPPGRRAVALGEVGGMPHPGHPGDQPARRGRIPMAAHSGEGHYLS